MRCTDPGPAALVDARLSALRCDPSGAADIVADIRGPTTDRTWPRQPDGRGRTVYDSPSGPITYYEESDELFVDYQGRARLLCRPGAGRIDMAITGAAPGDPVLATHPLLTIALLETMKRRGSYPLHAAGLSLGGRGVLVPGSSGAGKSTLSVILLRAGFDFLSDDTVFFETRPEGVWAWGFPDEVDVTPGTVAMFPELDHLAGRPPPLGREKHAFRVEEVFGVTPLAGCRPAALLFPRVVPTAAPALTPLSGSEALVELAPNLFLTQPAATQSHLDALAALVRAVPCYSFRVGVDLDAAAACVTGLLGG